MNSTENKGNKNPQDYIRFMNDCYYWDYIYKGNYILSYLQPELDSIMDEVKQLNKYYEEDYFTIRNIINAYHSSLNGIRTTFSLETLTPTEQEATKNIYEFCIHNLYYPWDITSLPSGEQIAECYLEHNACPYPPPVLVHNNQTREQMNCLKLLDRVMTDVVSEEFKMEICNYIIREQKRFKQIEKDINREAMPLSLSNTYTYRKQTRELNRRLFSGANNPLKKKQINAKLLKQIVKPPYRGNRSAWERIIGLMLWEAACEIATEKNILNIQTRLEHEKFVDSISNLTLLAEIGKKEIIKKISKDKDGFHDKMSDIRNTQRWYKATKESIQHGEFRIINN